MGNGLLELVDDDRRLVDQPDFAGPIRLGARKERDCGIDAGLLPSEIEDVAIRLGRIENAVGAGEGLDQAVMLEILVNVKRVEIHGVETGKKHIDNDGEVDLFGAPFGQVSIGELLVLDAFLDVLVVAVKIVDVVICAVLLVVVGDDGLERGLLSLRVLLVVFLLLGKVFLDLLNVLVALRRG